MMGQCVAAMITDVLGHHGGVASACRDLPLAQRLDKRLSSHAGRIVSDEYLFGSNDTEFI